jgi:hypothetical protein
LTEAPLRFSKNPDDMGSVFRVGSVQYDSSFFRVYEILSGGIFRKAIHPLFGLFQTLDCDHPNRMAGQIASKNVEFATHLSTPEKGKWWIL